MSAGERQEKREGAGRRVAREVRGDSFMLETGDARSGKPIPAKEQKKPPAKPVQLSMGKDGRLLIPAALRKEVGLSPGEKVITEVRDGALLIESVASRLRRVQALVRKYDKGSGSVVDEFIAEKRAEAERE